MVPTKIAMYTYLEKVGGFDPITNIKNSIFFKIRKEKLNFLRLIIPSK